MIFATSPRAVLILRALRIGGLALVALFVAHDLVYALEFGVGPSMDAAMSNGGHNGWWTPFMAAVALVGLGLVTGAAFRIGRLSALRSAVRAGRSATPADPRYGPELLRLWRGLFICVTLALLVQENMEHLLTRGHLLGLEPLAGPLTIPALALVTLMFAALGALVRWRIAVLERQIAAARATRWPRIIAAAAPGWSRLVAALLAHRWLLARQAPGRAPPLTSFR